MKKGKILNNYELVDFCGQLSLLLPTGIPLLDSIGLMAQDTSSEYAKALLAQIETSLRDGLSLHKALESTKVFPDYVISMVLLGEEVGKLDIIMEKLTEYYEQQCSIADAIKNAVRYPLIMLTLMLLIMAVLLTKILPIFDQVFLQLGSAFTGVAKQFINIGYGIQSIFGPFIILLMLIAIIALIIHNNPNGRTWYKHVLHTGRLTRKIFLEIAYSRFAGALSMITAVGIDIYKGLALADRLVDNELMTQKIATCSNALSKGGYLYEAITEAEMFQAQHRRMLQIGYRAGNSEVVFDKISKYYEAHTLSSLKKILGAIEPTLVIAFSLVVGSILLSVMMPLIGIMSTLG